MKVIDSISPVVFADAQIVAPEDVNRVFNYAADALDDVSEKRFAICPVLFPFVDDVATGLTNASPLNLRTYRFTCPVNCTILRAFIDGNVTAGAQIDVNLTAVGTGLPPPGATTPFLALPAGSVIGGSDVNDINVQKVQLSAGVEYALIISGTSFTTARADVILHVAVDRWFLVGNVAEPAFNPIRFVDELADGEVLNDENISALANAASQFTARGMACFLVFARNFHSATPAAQLTFTVPSYIAARTNARLVRAYLTTSSSAGIANVTATVRDAAAVVVLTLTRSTTTTIGTTASGTLAIPLNVGDPSAAAQDFSVTFTTAFVSPQVCQRACLLLWCEW